MGQREWSIRARWQRLSDWLGLDRDHAPDLLTTDPAEHFRRWDRDLPDRYAG
ncbi:MAG: hypothetical protein AAFO29_08945 [Actinomycetota bacterium]